MLKPMPNPKLMPRPTPPSFTPMLTVMPLSIPTDTTLTPLVLFMPLPSVRLMKSKDLTLRLTLMLMPGVTTDVTTDTPDTTDGVEDITDTQDTIMENKPSFQVKSRSATHIQAYPKILNSLPM